MLTVLIIAGFLGLLAPWLGFAALFIGAMFLASIAAGITSLVLIGLLIYIIGVGYRETHP